MLLSAVSVLVVAQSSSEIPEGLMNNPLYKSLQHNVKAKMNVQKQSIRQSLEELRTGLRSKLDTKLGRGLLCHE